MSRPIYLMLMPVLAATLCGCGGGHSSGYEFAGHWTGMFSDTRAPAATDLSLDVVASDPSAPLDERDYTFTGNIGKTTSGGPILIGWETIGSMSGTITAQGRMGVEYNYISETGSYLAIGRASVVSRPLPYGSHMVGSISTYGSGALVAQQEFDLRLSPD
jgi:hypothetical protein